MLLFGTAGTPHSSAAPSSECGIIRVQELGLECMELEFVHGVQIGEKTASKVKETAESRGIRLSVHAPYYINLNSQDPEKIEASKVRILQAARAAHWCGAKDVVFHPAFYHKQDPEEVFQKVKASLVEILEQIKEEGLQVTLRPETTGKSSQFGTLQETIRLSAELEGVLPCVDFAHLHAREGAMNTPEEFAWILDQIQAGLGRRGLDHMHIHLAGIAYTKSGERHHLMMQESDYNLEGLLEALLHYDVGGEIICESPNIEEDALLFQETYRALSK